MALLFCNYLPHFCAYCLLHFAICGFLAMHVSRPFVQYIIIGVGEREGDDNHKFTHNNLFFQARMSPSCPHVWKPFVRFPKQTNDFPFWRNDFSYFSFQFYVFAYSGARRDDSENMFFFLANSSFLFVHVWFLCYLFLGIVLSIQFVSLSVFLRHFIFDMF